MRRRETENDYFCHNKTLLQFPEEGDDKYGWARLIAYWPHLPYGKTTLPELAGWWARHPLDAGKI